MAQNDMFVIMYKMISYLYECMKGGVSPADERWSAREYSIPDSYWRKIVIELVRHDYVKGVEIDVTTLGTAIRPVDPYVTMEGVQFAQENSMMAKARSFLQDATGIVLSFV